MSQPFQRFTVYEVDLEPKEVMLFSKPIFVSALVFFIMMAASCRKDTVIEQRCDSDCSCDADSLYLFSAESGQEFLYDSAGRLVSYYTPSHILYGTNNTSIEWTYSGDRLVNFQKGGSHGESLIFDYSGDTAQVHYWAELTVSATYTLIVDDNGFALAYAWYSNPDYGDSATYHYNGSLLPDSVVYYGNGLAWPEKLFYTNGMLTKALLYDSDGALFQVKEFSYDENGRWTKYLRTGGYGGGPEERQYYYNCCGQLVQSIMIWGADHDTLANLDYQQTGCGEFINMNPVNYYRYPYMRMPGPF